MGLFGFGKKKHRKDEGEAARDAVTDDETKDTAEDASAQTDADTADGVAKDEPAFTDEPSETYEERGESYGPWDVNDEDVPNYDDYLDLGAYYLPFMQNIELRIKADRASGAVLGCTITYKSSSLEVEALAAPKTMGLWDDVRADLLSNNKNAVEKPGAFGMEVTLPVTIKGGKKLTTRIVGVDGPRWMLRGIFSGPAAHKREGEEAKALDKFFSDIVVDRGEEPLAPRDLVPMHAPVTPDERKKSEQEETDEDGNVIPKRPKGPFDADQQVEVQTTISRGPMFSEVR